MNPSTAVDSLSPESGLLLVLAVEAMTALYGCLTDACQTELTNDFNEAVDNIDGGRNEQQFRTLLQKKFKCSCVLQSFKGGGHRDI